MTLTTLAREIREVKSYLEINDMVNEKEAAELLGVSLKGFRNKQYEGKFEGKYIINAAGKRSYYKSRLLNLK